MKTSLYNHNSIGEKPTIPNIIFKGLVWLSENNFYEECEYLKGHYSLTPFQEQVYKRYFDLKLKTNR